uniref:Sushi domain-containing protein n=1 Tax=Plectus sambesii TaxID=2011161 RepID=A0A914WD39_9BILA
MSCLYDYTLLQLKVLGLEVKDSWSSFVQDRWDATRRYNSCGAINIEYPEYLFKTSTLSSGYLEGDVARFECFQSHWMNGDNEYTCVKVIDPQDQNRYGFEWNKGWQPWCRERERDVVLQWLTAIISILTAIMFITLIFACCWCAKQRSVQQRRDQRKKKSPLTGEGNASQIEKLTAQEPSWAKQSSGMTTPTPESAMPVHQLAPYRPTLLHSLEESQPKLSDLSSPRHEPQLGPIVGLRTSV